MTTQTKTAVVTGAARGIGACVAARLGTEGFNVAVLDVEESSTADTVSAVRATGREALGLGVDVSDPDSVEAGVARIVTELGPPTVLVNNAGITRDNLIFKMSIEDWELVMNVHLRGSFLMSRAIQRHMVEAGWGRVVNLSSTSALGRRGQANYSSAKAGLQGFTRTLAIELGPYGVTVNCIAPGFISTAMTEATAHRLGVDFEKYKELAAAEIPVRRVGLPEDIAQTVAFFVDEHSGFVNGQVLYVAGGPKS
ncbi:MAG: 3-oxoacyl-ACP reductase FabG [Acidimicrobiales bacterium]